MFTGSWRPGSLCHLMVILGIAATVQGQDAKNVDPFMGEYEGVYRQVGRADEKAEAKVIAEGDGSYRVMIRNIPRSEDEWPVEAEVYGRTYGDLVRLYGWSMGVPWQGEMSGETLSVRKANGYGGEFELEYTVRKSPTEGLEPPDEAVVLLPFEAGTPPSLEAWTEQDWTPMEDGSVEVAPGNGPLRTKEDFRDITLHLEFMVPFEPRNRGQARANSGVFLNGLYEAQVLDSFGLVPAAGDCGALYNHTTPRVNASLPPGTWQTYDAEFRAPRLGENGDVIELPRLTLRHNGILIHEDVEIQNPTANRRNPHRAEGPIELQDHGNMVRYRNIWLVED